jgi:hypothetical protein
MLTICLNYVKLYTKLTKGWLKDMLKKKGYSRITEGATKTNLTILEVDLQTRKVVKTISFETSLETFETVMTENEEILDFDQFSEDLKSNGFAYIGDILD